VIRAVLAYGGWWSRPKVTVGLAGPPYPAVRPLLRACCAWALAFGNRQSHSAKERMLIWGERP
jgi:hypothetical protein